MRERSTRLRNTNVVALVMVLLAAFTMQDHAAVACVGRAVMVTTHASHYVDQGLSKHAA